MATRSIALLWSVTLAAACGSAGTSSTDGTSSPVSATVASSDTASSTFTVAPSSSNPATTLPDGAQTDGAASSVDVLVVRRVDPGDASDLSYVVVAQDGTELKTLEPPAALDEPLAITSIHQAPGAALALVEGHNWLGMLDAGTLQLEMYMAGARIEWRDPEARFLIVSSDDQFEVIDLPTLTRYYIGSVEQFLSAVATGERLVVTILDAVQQLTVIVDVAADSVEVLEGATGAERSYDDSGEQYLVRNESRSGGETATEFLVTTASDPATQRAWYTSDAATSAVWGDDSLVILEQSTGRVLVATAESAVDIGVLPGDGPRGMRGDPTTSGVLIAPGTDGSSSWYHVDPVTRTLTELTGLQDLRSSASVPSRPGLLMLDDATSGPNAEVSRVVAVQVRDGRVTDIVATPNRNSVSGRALSDDLVTIGLGSDTPLQIFDLETGKTITLDDAVFAILSPDPATAAVVFGSAPTRTTSLLDRSTGTLRDLGEGQAIAWLQR